MPAPNPATFPLVPYPGPAPEAPPRFGGGGWEPYALTGPTGRLLPFVLARSAFGATAWVNCAHLEHADTGTVLATLRPLGQGVPVPPLGLVLTKYADAGDGLEYFAYFGATVPGLNIPCGVPVRLVLDTNWQGPRFTFQPDAEARSLRLSWQHPTPLLGVPYGGGAQQVFYAEQAALQLLDPRTEKTSTKHPDTGAERTDFEAQWPQRSLLVGPVPAYLAEALAASSLHGEFTADGEPWRVVSTKTAPVGIDAGRWTATLTLESLTPALRRGCGLPVPVAHVFDPVADAPRGWSCGDASDTAPDYGPTGIFTCEVSSGVNTGYTLTVFTDRNRFSPTYQQPQTRRSPMPDETRCPVPLRYQSSLWSGTTLRNDCPLGFDPGPPVYFEIPASRFTSTVSQAEADQQARAAYEAGRQAHANQFGACVDLGTVDYNPVYGPEGCFACQMVNPNDPNDVRAATSAEAAQYFRTYADNGLNCLSCQ